MSWNLLTRLKDKDDEFYWGSNDLKPQSKYRPWVYMRRSYVSTCIYTYTHRGCSHKYLYVCAAHITVIMCRHAVSKTFRDCLVSGPFGSLWCFGASHGGSRSTSGGGGWKYESAIVNRCEWCQNHLKKQMPFLGCSQPTASYLVIMTGEQREQWVDWEILRDRNQMQPPLKQLPLPAACAGEDARSLSSTRRKEPLAASFSSCRFFMVLSCALIIQAKHHKL